MLFQGPFSPKVITTVPYGTVDWINPNNVLLSNDKYSSVNVDFEQSSYLLIVKDFGFTLPDNVTVEEAVVDIQCNSPNPHGLMIEGYLVVDGVVKDDGQSETSAIALQILPIDSFIQCPLNRPSLWGVDLSDVDVNNKEFGFGLYISSSIESVIFNLNHIRMTIYYS